MNSSGIDSSDIIAICSAVIAILAFLATTWQAWLAHDHNRLSVRPLLAWHIGREGPLDGASIIYSVWNLGLSPAVIKDRYFTKDGTRFESPVIATDEVGAFLEFVLVKKVEYQLKVFGLPGRGTAIPSKGEVVIAKIYFPGQFQLASLRTVARVAAGRAPYAGLGRPGTQPVSTEVLSHHKCVISRPNPSIGSVIPLARSACQ
jgi:hypothetical protein